MLAAVEHIGQRAVVAGDAAACELVGGILLQALDGPSASRAMGAVASMAVADPRLLRPVTSAALLSRVIAAAGAGKTYSERAVASEALRRLVAPRVATALASARRRVVQSLLEAEWAAPEVRCFQRCE